MSSTYEFFNITSAASGYLSFPISAVFCNALIAIFPAGRSPKETDVISCKKEGHIDDIKPTKPKNLDDREREKKNRIIESPLLKRLMNSDNLRMKNSNKRKAYQSHEDTKAKMSTVTQFEGKSYKKESLIN